MKLSFASVVSVLFEPSFILLITTIFAGWYTGLRNMAYVLYLLLLITTVSLVSIGRLFFARSHNTNWDISDSSKRKKIVWYLLVVVIVVFLTIIQFRNTQLTQLFLLFLYWAIGFAGISQFFKLSGHIGILTLCISLFVSWQGSLALLWLLLPLLAWSRITLKRHTMSEVIGGFLYTILLVFTFT